MTFDGLDDYDTEVARLPPEDETKAREQAAWATQQFRPPIKQTGGQLVIDFTGQQELFL